MNYVEFWLVCYITVVSLCVVLEFRLEWYITVVSLCVVHELAGWHLSWSNGSCKWSTRSRWTAVQTSTGMFCFLDFGWCQLTVFHCVIAVMQAIPFSQLRHSKHYTTSLCCSIWQLRLIFIKQCLVILYKDIIIYCIKEVDYTTNQSVTTIPEISKGITLLKTWIKTAFEGR